MRTVTRVVAVGVFAVALAAPAANGASIVFEQNGIATHNLCASQPVVRDYEDNTIVGNATVVGLRTCWAGFIRNTVGHDVVFSNNRMGDPDGNEVVSNKVGHNLFCFDNRPAAQIGDSMGSLNDVDGRAFGQCRALSAA